MLRHVVVDHGLEAHQQRDALFSLDRFPTYPTHDPSFDSALRPDRPSDYALLTINSRHLKHEIAGNKLLSMRLGDEVVF